MPPHVVSEMSAEVEAAFDGAKIVALDVEGVDLSRIGEPELLYSNNHQHDRLSVRRQVQSDPIGGAQRRGFPVLPV